MKIHICAAFLYTIQSLRVHSLREPNEDQKNELKTDAGAAEECGKVCRIANEAPMNTSQRKAFDDERRYIKKPRERDIPSWMEMFSKDSNGPLHMALGSSILAVSLALALTTKPRKRKGLLTFSKAERPKFIYEAKEDADVDAEGSDDEITEASHEPSSPSKAPTTLKLGPGMRFLDEELEQEWEKESYFRNVQRGAVLLALVACGMIFDRFYAFWELRSCKGDQWRIFQLLQIVAMIVLAKVFAFLFMVPAMEGAGVELGERSKMLWDLAYWLVIGFFSLFFLAVNVPPFNPSCEMLALMATGEMCSDPALGLANKKMDCTLQGHTACQMFQLWMLIMPYSLPQFRCWHFTFIWLVFLYVGFSWLYAEVTDESTHMVDVPLHSCMLIVTAALGTMKKYYLEKGMRRQFLEDNEQRKALERLYSIFDGMVPKYVIPRMLTQEPICDYRERVTILFVLIHDFHVSDANAALTFLNEYFGKMDDICAAHKVTKIETVAEEYVACVGVLPEDLPTDTSDPVKHHQSLLLRLFSAAYEIQKLQDTAQKKFKMGMHTGAIRAGVIGRKLPRFRLFGDTINTSARMMQKAEPGELMFGEQTNDLLPDTLKAASKAYRNKEGGDTVKMKGKGDVKVFLFDAANFTTGGSTATSTREGPEKPKEMEVKHEVDKVMRHVAGGNHVPRQLLPFILSEKADFTTEEELQRKKHMFSEATFQMWFHMGFVRKFRLRLHRQLLLMAFMTVCDLIHMEHAQAWEKQDKNPGLLPPFPDQRFMGLLLCRCLCLAVGVAWSFFARTEAFREKVQEVQWGLVASNVIVATLMFVSYDAMIFPQIDKPYTEMHFLDYLNQQQSLIFVLAYFIVTNTHPTLFYQSLVYIPAGLIFMGIRDRTGLYISNIGRVIFLCTVLISCLLAHLLEQTSRARFKAKQRVEATQDTIETVLTSLMPTQVLEEIKTSPGRSHSYHQATIAQSDLCGFTQLASDRTPEEVVEFVKDLFGRFDILTDRFNVYKVETVGDAYIAGMAEPPLTAKQSPIEVVKFGMAMIEATARWAENLGVQVTCRVGVHHGQCVGGVVGKGMQRYHLFGNFMSQLDTLEATSREGITQISSACKDAIVMERLGRKATSEAAFETLLKDELRCWGVSFGATPLEAAQHRSLGRSGWRPSLTVPPCLRTSPGKLTASRLRRRAAGVRRVKSMITRRSVERPTSSTRTPKQPRQRSQHDLHDLKGDADVLRRST
ncbi:unnamed protein product [Durusdinium trenchii]|uniref:Guanylate cyclase domain-containing protein n=1 Tax=Durusdinium trenchii TaxID=1381693 RepID=A0ABP0J9I5_9DINO